MNEAEKKGLKPLEDIVPLSYVCHGGIGRSWITANTLLLGVMKPRFVTLFLAEILVQHGTIGSIVG
jgi:hypothetical protein